ncbi:MAG: anti-sigma factor antagonist [Candidatus Omnitrophota bacterium]
MEIRVRASDNIIILDISGQIDVNSANLVETIGQCIRDGYSDILCNFEEVSSIDYMGLSVIAIAYKEVLNNEGRMKFVNVPAHLKNLLSVTGLNRTIESYATEEMAINSFREDKAIENIKKMQLRRRFKRLPVDLKAEVRLKYGGLVCSDIEILNLSAVGAYIFGCDKFKLGDEVILKFNIPPKAEVMELDAKVVWFCDRQIQPQLYPGVGVSFYNIETSVQEKLLGFIERNLSLLSPED